MKQPFQVEDLTRHRRVGELDCTPHGERVVCTVRSIDADTGQVDASLWMFALDGSRTTPLTHGPGTDRSPKWSPDGTRIAFLSTRDGGSAQVCVLDLVIGGEAQRIGSFANGVADLRWFPDGNRLLVTATVDVDPELRGRRSSEPAPARDASAPEIAWRLPYKADGVGYLLQRETHLFVVDVASGEQSRMTDGPFDVLGCDIAPDGRVAYARSRDGRFAHRSDLWICDADGGGQRRMTVSQATVVQPMWSPDQRAIAFSGAAEEGDAEPRLWTCDVPSGRVRRIGSDSLDIADGKSLRWEADDRIVFVRAFRGRHQVVTMGVGDAEPTVLAAGDRQLGAFDATGAHLAYVVDHPSLPSELWVRPRAGGDERQLSRFNGWWHDRVAIEATIRTFEVPDGDGGSEVVEGWLLRQRGTSGPAPLLNDVHGGPAAYALLDFESNVYWQVLCARGWIVLALNAVGSASYGSAFCRRLLGHWGEHDMPQHLAAVRALQADGVCDDRVAIAGKSYGGYLSAWSIGHTDVYRAAVVMAPVGNIETHYGTSDGGYYADPYYLDSRPRFDRRLARALSPLQHIEHATTPTLFLQGKDDERCPRCQSEELFVSLLRGGDTPAELVLYPNEGHAFLAGGATSTRIDANRRIVEWITRHVAAPTPASHDVPVAIEAVES